MHENSVMPRKKLTFPLYLIFILLFLSAISGCTSKVKLVGEYDQIVDESVTELQKSTMIFFCKNEKGI